MNNSGQRIGKGMIYAAWLLVLGLLFLFFNHFLGKQYNPNQKPIRECGQDGYCEVILQQNRGGHYMASGMINGQPVNFLLDTGATTVSIPQNVASRLHLVRGIPILANTANGTITTYSTELERVALGEIELYQVPASINPYMSSDEILLGMSFLRHLEFTQRGDILILRQSYSN